MYEDYFSFKEKPFNITPDPNFLFLSQQHKNAISSLEFGLMDNAGLILLTGDIGTGKTTIIRHILGKIDDDFVVTVVSKTNVNADQLLGIILDEFGIRVQSDLKTDPQKEFHQFLVELHSKHRRPLLVIDEAQGLSMEALEEVRLLSNLHSHNKMLLQIMIVGQPELNAKLKNPSMASLFQRIAVNYHLQAFNREDTGRYIAHRLENAGGRADLFTDAAVTMIHKLTGGTPRSINFLCHAALVYGFADDIPMIDVPVIEEIVADTRETGIGTERWHLDQSEMPAPQIVDGIETQLPSEMDSVKQQQTRNDLEGRIGELERRLADYTKDLREALNLLLTKERSRNDKLLMAYTKLKTRYEDLLKAQANKDRPEADAADHTG